MPAKSRWWWALGAVLAVVALAGVWSAAAPAPPPTQDEQIRAVAQTLRCPTCIGEDVADSASPIAEAMRLVVAEQVAQGQSKEEIQAWFAQRYGDEVLLEPPRSGAGWVFWVLPLGVLGTGVAWLARGYLRRRTLMVVVPVMAVAAVVGVWTAQPAQDTAVTSAQEPMQVSPAPVLAEAADDAPGNLSLRLALARTLEGEERFAEAAEEYAAAVRLRPMDPDMRYRHAFTLVRDDRAEEAAGVLDDALQVDPDHPPSLLLLGSIREQADQVGTEHLQRFLEVAPDHPSAAQVRQWLDGQGQLPTPQGQ